MTQILSPSCDCPDVADLVISASGGVEGYNTSHLPRSSGTLTERWCTLAVNFDAFDRKDRLNILTNIGGGVDVVTTGCIAGSYVDSIRIPPGIGYVDVLVTPECDPAQTSPPTAWTLSVTLTEDRCP